MFLGRTGSAIISGDMGGNKDIKKSRFISPILGVVILGVIVWLIWRKLGELYTTNLFMFIVSLVVIAMCLVVIWVYLSGSTDA